MDYTMLAEIFIQQAEWREEKASEYPDDKRNLEAAKHLREIAATAERVDQALITAAEELNQDAPDIEIWNEMLRQEGFHSWHSDAEHFVRGYISKRSSGQ